MISFSEEILTTMPRIPKTMNPKYHLTPSTRSNANTSSIGDLSLEGTLRRTKILLTTHLPPQGLLDHPIAHHLPETPMTTTETTMTILAFHHLDDPHLGDQEASLGVHPHLLTTLTPLTTRSEDLHGFRTQGPLEAPELPTILTVTADPLEDRLEDLLETTLSWRTPLSWRPTSWVSVLSLDSVPVSAATTREP